VRYNRSMLHELLRATGELAVALPDGRSVALPMCSSEFEPWAGTPLEFTFGGKPTFVHDGQPVWAEFKVAGLFRDAGWDALVIEAYGGLHVLRSTKTASAANP
jgi:hypothetical protein